MDFNFDDHSLFDVDDFDTASPVNNDDGDFVPNPITPVHDASPTFDEEDEDNQEDDIELEDEPVREEDEAEEGDDAGKAYFEALKEYGVLDLPEDYEFDGNIEDTLSISDKRKSERIANSIWEKLPDDFKPLLTYGLKGGNSLQEYLKAYAPVDYDELDTAKPADAKRIMYDYYQETSNYSPEKINNFIARLEKTDSLEEAAREAREDLKDLVEQRKAELLENVNKENEEKAKLVQAQTEQLTKAINDFQGIETQRKDRLKSFIFSSVKTDAGSTTAFNKTIQDIFNNPEHVVQLADILADYHSAKGFDFERIKKRLKTETTRTFKELLNSKLDSKTQVKGSPKRSIKEDFDWDGFLNS